MEAADETMEDAELVSPLFVFDRTVFVGTNLRSLNYSW